ncbi:phage tail tape measure protein, partial [Bacillus atrophaeus]|uniref:phage tail tape measure protein n=3 Tax=Bacillus atrophaeus TaxID=1452 RepID=UPI002280DAA0
MSQNLKIILTPQADASSSTVEQLNKQIKTLQGKLNTLKLNTDIDSSTLKTLKEFSSAVETYQKNLKSYNQTVRETSKVVKNADGTVDKLSQQYKKNGEILQRETQIIDNRNKSLKEQTQEVNKLASATEKLGQVQKKTEQKNTQGQTTRVIQKNRNGFDDITYATDPKTNATSSKITTNYDQQRKAIDQLNQKLEVLRQKGLVSSEVLSRLSTSINGAKTSSQIDQIANRINQIDDSSTAKAKTKELERQLQLYQRQAQVNAQNLNARSSGSMSGTNTAALQSYLNSVNQLSTRTPNLRAQMQNLNMQFREITANVSSATSRVTSFGDQLTQSFSRMPAYLLTGTAFYSGVQALKSMVQQVIEIDTLMTNIRRVMDLPDYKFNELLQSSIDLGDQLSNKISDILEITGSFGRMGFDESELGDVTKTAQVLQNISDLNPTDTVNTLTAAMLNFNVAAGDSISIADKLNEVDNNYAVSTLDLANSIRKAGSTASTFGVELNDLIGYTTAIASTTRESGNIVGNSLKTIFARIGNNNSSIKALEQIGISVKTASGEAKTSSDLIEELAGKWDTLSDAQKQNTSIGVAGIYQLSRFNALMNNYTISQSAASTAANSVGSSWKEQQKYADSLEARINRLSNSFTEMSVASGEALISDSIVVFADVLKVIVQTSAQVTKSIGLLPQVFGAATAAVLLFNSSLRASTLASGTAMGAALRNLALNFNAVTVGVTAASARTVIWNKVTTTFNNTLVGLKKAAMTTGAFLAGSFLPMAAMMAMGVVIEKLISSYSKLNQAREDYEQAKMTSIEAITTNKDSTDELIAQYEELQKAKEAGTLSSEKEQEYLQVTQQLAQTFPNLISGYNSQGQAIIKNNDALKDAIKYTEDLADLNKKDIQTGANSNFKDSLKDINKLKDEIDQYKQIAEFYKNEKKPFWDFISSDSDYKNQGIKAAEDALRTEQSLSSSQAKIREQVMQTVDAFNSVKINPQLSKEINDAFSKIDFSKMDAAELESFSINVAKYMDNIQKALSSGNQNNFSKASQDLENLINQYLEGKDKANGLVLSYGDLKEAIDSTKNAAENSKVAWDENGEGVDALGDSVGTLSDKLKDAKGDFEAIAAIINDLVDSKQNDLAISALTNEAYDSMADSISPLNELLEKMAEGKSLSASEAMKLIQKESDLADAISVENGVVKINRDAVVKLRDIKLKAYNDMQQSVKQDLINQANALNKKINMYKSEVKAIKTVQDAYDMKSDIEKQKQKILEEMKKGNGGAIQYLPKTQEDLNQVSDITSQLEELDKLADLASSSLSETGTSMEDLSSSSEKASEEIKTSMYVADKYKESLEKVNAEIDKYNKQVNDYPKYSQKYRDAIKKEIKALQQKKKLMQEQAKLLKEQIKSGNITQYGIVTSSSPSAGSSGGSYSSSGGSYSGKYSSYIN